MALTDTDITDWQDDFTGEDTNSPKNSDKISTMLDDQARLIQSVVRAQAEDKGWVKPGLLVTRLNSEQFSTPGDQRDTFVFGRRVRAMTGGSTIVGGAIYGTISDSAYASNLTTVTVIWDPVRYDSFALVACPTPDSVNFAGLGALPDFGASDRVEFWNLTTGTRKVRVISTVTHPAGQTTLNFITGDPYVDVDVNDISVMMVHSAGMDNTLIDVHVGLMTPDLFQSGWSHSMLSGEFVIAMVGIGPYTINLPVALQDGSYIPQVQSKKITTGVASSDQWAKPILTARLAVSFDVTLPEAITGATARYFYTILR